MSAEAARRVLRLMRARMPSAADRLAPIKSSLERRLAGSDEVERDPRGAALAAAIAEATRRLDQALPADAALAEEARNAGSEALRVLHVIGGLAPGGAERQVVSTVAGLRQRGFACCDLVVTDDPGDPAGAYRQRLGRVGVQPILAGRHCDRRFMQRLAADPRLVRAGRAIPEVLRPRCADLFGEFVVRRPHVVHCWLDHTNIWGGVAAALAGVPAIVLSTRSVAPTHFPPLLQPWLAPWYRTLASRPGVSFVNNSNAGADDYARWLELPRERLSVILNGVDFESMTAPAAAEVATFRRSLGAAEGDPVLTGILRLGEEKRPEIFVRVAQILLARVPRLHVVIVGGGPMERQVRDWVAAGPSPQRVHMLGRRHDVPTILSASTLLLLTSRMEGTPNVLLEAQHFGCPAVTTAAGGAVDAVLDGVSGAIRPVDDVSGLAEACFEILNDPARRRTMGEAARRFVTERFGLDRMLDETLLLHRRALDDAAAGGATRHGASMSRLVAGVADLPSVQVSARQPVQAMPRMSFDDSLSSSLRAAGVRASSVPREVGRAAPASEGPGITFEFVTPPRRVAVVKGAVEGLRRRAPWIFVCLAPVKPLFSGLYYGWINRHERVSIQPRVRLIDLESGRDLAGAVSPPAGSAAPSIEADPAERASPTVNEADHAAAGLVGVNRPAHPAQATPTSEPERECDPGIHATGGLAVVAGAESCADHRTDESAERCPIAVPDAASLATAVGPARSEPGIISGERAPQPERCVIANEEPSTTEDGAIAQESSVEEASAPASAVVEDPARRFAEAAERAMRLSAQRPAWEGKAGRVAMIIGTLGPGGAERQLVTLARAFVNRGQGRCRAVTIREPSGNDGHHLDALDAAAELHRSLPLDLRAAFDWLDREDLDHVRLVLPPELCGDVAALLQVLRRLQPAVVHAWLDWSSVVAGLAAMLLPVRRIVLSTRNVGPHNFPTLDQPFFREMYRILLRDPRVRLINNSSAGADDYARWLDVPRRSIRVVRNGVDPGEIVRPDDAEIAALRRELEVEPSAKLVAGVFRLSEEKQPDDFVAVAERILAADPDAVVVHAGSGALAEAMRERVASSPVADRLRLLGRRHDVPILLSASHLCLLTSRQEGTPNALIEAQHLGCPVVATRAGGAPESFDPGRSGLLCEVGDVAGLAEAALRLLRDEPMRRAMGEHGARFVRRRFSLARMANDTMALYD